MLKNKKYNIVVSASDGRRFYQTFQVIEENPQKAASWLLSNWPDAKIRNTVKIEEVAEIEDAELLLPGIVYKSGKGYLNTAP